jgi:hypothetical protein
MICSTFYCNYLIESIFFNISPPYSRVTNARAPNIVRGYQDDPHYVLSPEDDRVVEQSPNKIHLSTPGRRVIWDGALAGVLCTSM